MDKEQYYFELKELSKMGDRYLKLIDRIKQFHPASKERKILNKESKKYLNELQEYQFIIQNKYCVTYEQLCFDMDTKINKVKKPINESYSDYNERNFIINKRKYDDYSGYEIDKDNDWN